MEMYSSTNTNNTIYCPSTLEYIRDIALKLSNSHNLDFSEEILKGISNAAQQDDSTCQSLLHYGYNPSQQVLHTVENYEFRSLRGLSTSADNCNSNSEENGGANFGLDVTMVCVCLLCAGLASGLTQGLLSLDTMEMTIKSRSGNADEKKYASQVLPIISRHHLLLVTLMLWNATATESLPIFLSGLVPEWVAIVISVTMVLFVGEIIPAAILTGPKQLEIAAKLIPLVYLVLGIFFILAYPISLVLDYVIGHDEGMKMYNKKELVTMVNIQHEEGVRMRQNSMLPISMQRAKSFQAVFTGGNNGIDATDEVASNHSDYQHNHHRHHETLHQDEVTIIGGALTFADMTLESVMTPIESVFFLSSNAKLNNKVK